MYKLMFHTLLLFDLLTRLECSRYSEKLKEEAQQEEEAERDLKMAAARGNGIAASPFMHPICGPASAFGRSALHRAVCDMNVTAIQNSLTSDLAKRDEAGYCPLHTAAALSMLTPSNTNLAFDISQLLISAGADATFVDSNGNTPLHWAARAGNERVAHLMLLNKCQTGTFL
jgi:ankyrin repeat protein